MVDDELDVNFIIKATLEKTDYFKLIHLMIRNQHYLYSDQGLYDLALLDIKMPEMNGFQLCRKLREIENRLKYVFDYH